MDDRIRWREEIEWQNIWWEQANSVDVKRIALLGDSVTRGLRSRMNRYLEGKYVVDLCASSSQITDSLLHKEIKFFFECSEWKYCKILIQIGGQHGYARICCEDRGYGSLFEQKYVKLLSIVQRYCKDILIISFTPNVEKDDLKKWDPTRNLELKKRNEIIKKIADGFSIQYIDIWDLLIKERFEYKDHIHMKEEGNDFIARYLCRYL